MGRNSYLRSLAAVALAGAFVLALGTQAKAATVTIVPGTALNVHVVGSLSSATASPGETFQIAAAEALLVQGLQVVTPGAVGQGHVVSATPAGKSGKQGNIKVQLDWIYAADGQQIPLTATARAVSGDNKTGQANTANVAATLIFGPVGLFAHNFVKGKDVVVNSSFVFPAYTGEVRTVSVVTSNGY